jgi:tetratricopeptide (TPR) repeat protein
MSISTLFGDARWIVREAFKSFLNPIGVLGGVLDIARGWKFSRNWVAFWINLPAIVLLASVYIIFAFFVFSRRDSQIQRFSVESETRCTTKSLENAYHQSREEEFTKLPGFPVSTAPKSGFEISDLTRRYVELLGKRIVAIDPTNQLAHYRLGLIYSISGKSDEAMEEMADLAAGKYGESPPANAWMAKERLIAKAKGKEVAIKDLLENLELAGKWKDTDYRLMLVYSSLLEQSNDIPKAIETVKKAVLIKPELNLDLARLYARIGNEEGLREAAFFVEEYYAPKLNTPQEVESDRLAVAEARRLTGRLERAEEVLSEGFSPTSTRVQIRRSLSEVQRALYNKSIREIAKGFYTADLSLLEKAAETDPANSNISGDIARLLPLKIKPTKKLLEVLKKQDEDGITSATAHMILAEGYYALGKTKEAMKHWERGLTKEPGNLIAINNLALCLAKQPKPELDRAFELLNRAITLAPNNPEILDSLGETLMIANRPKEAINKFEMAIRQDNRRIATRKRLVSAYQAVGLEAEAIAQNKVIESLEKTLQAEPVRTPPDEESREFFPSAP